MKQQLKQRVSPWVLQWFRQWMDRKFILWFRRKPLWLAIGVCAIGGIFLGALLSKTVQQHVLLSNSANGLRQTSLMFTQAPARRQSSSSSGKPHLRKGLVAQKSPRLAGAPSPWKNQSLAGDASTDCATSPQQSPKPQLLVALKNLPIDRFRLTAGRTPGPASEQSSVAHYTNFGWRFLTDWQGRSALHEPIVVLHETVGSFESAMNVFSTSHPDDDDQVSYHALIRENGAIVYVVPPEYRAYGAGDSVFVNAAYQEESVQTKPTSPPSVNNFAYHISLVTPEEGRNNNATHAGYTKNQYEALAWLISKTGISDERITTHKLVDRSGSRIDPRSFNAPYFLERLHSYPRTQEVIIGCTLPDSPQPPNPKS
jgi:hypothetical protein